MGTEGLLELHARVNRKGTPGMLEEGVREWRAPLSVV